MGNSLVDWESSKSAVLGDVRLESFPELQSVVWIQTSGSSGTPKWIGLKKDSILESAKVVNSRLSAQASDRWGVAISDRHIGGLAIHARAHLSGSRVERYFDRKWNPLEFERWLLESGTNLLSLVPTQLHDLIRHQIRCPKSVRRVLIGGGRTDEFLLKSATELGWPVSLTYGMTETSSQVALSDVGQLDLVVLDHAEILIDDEHRVGVRSRSLLEGVVTFKEGRASFVDPKRDGIFWTQDLGSCDRRVFKWEGRLDRSVKVKGHLLNLDQLEMQIQQKFRSLSLGEAVLGSVPDLRDENRLVLWFVGNDVTQITRLVQDITKHPISCVQVKNLSRTSNGKWDRPALVQSYLQGL
ncbi:MAG: AMP-binding protein [Bdellovibrionales bacterium]|nr:AMP-binding protein [Bdellovibrionales bacterium]